MALADVLLRAQTTFQDVSFYLNKVVIVLVIILCGFILGKIMESLLRSLFMKMNVDERLTKIFHAKRNYARAIRRTVVRIIYICTVIIALNKLAVVREVFVVLLVLVLFVVITSWVLAGIDVIPNLLARGSLHRRKITVGDEIVLTHPTGTLQGTIVDMTLTDVRLKRRNGDLLFIPNAVFLKESVVRKHH
jgi:small-conductance mechanosensitive channel